MIRAIPERLEKGKVRRMGGVEEEHWKGWVILPSKRVIVTCWKVIFNDELWHYNYIHIE